MKSLIFVFAAVLSAPMAFGQAIFDGKTGQISNLEDALKNVQAGDVVVLGENHGFKEHQTQHMAILQQLRSQGLKVSVGMEFFNYTDQALVQQWREGVLSEAEFLDKIGWKSPSFDYYSSQAQFPRLSVGEKTIALNAPRWLTSKVAKQGLSSLTVHEQLLLPPQFALGRETYKDRFLAMMPHLPSQEAGARYFAAQSIWDDTMAWTAMRFRQEKPDQVLVIIVGEFHVQYGGGLPDRLWSRGFPGKVWTWSQVNTAGLTAAEIEEAKAPHSLYGPRADFIWVGEAFPAAPARH